MYCRINVGEIDTNTMTAWWQDIASRLNWPNPHINADYPGYIFTSIGKGSLINGRASLDPTGELHIDLSYAESYPETLDMALNASRVLVDAVVELATSNGQTAEVIFEEFDVERTSAEYARYLDEKVKTSYRTYDRFPTTRPEQVRYHHAQSIWSKGTYSQCVARHQEWLATAPTQLAWLGDQIGTNQTPQWDDVDRVSNWYAVNIHTSPECTHYWNPDVAPLSAPGNVNGGPYSIDTLWKLDAIAHYLTVAITEVAPHITWYIPKKPTAREMDRQPRLHHDTVVQAEHPMSLAMPPSGYTDNNFDLRELVSGYVSPR